MISEVKICTFIRNFLGYKMPFIKVYSDKIVVVGPFAKVYPGNFCPKQFASSKACYHTSKEHFQGFAIKVLPGSQNPNF